MVKVQDLGYKSTNLQEIPSEDEKKKNQVDAAIANLASQTPPDKLHPPLPQSLFEGLKEQ